MKPIDIFITSFFRLKFTLECVTKIQERTKHPFRLHIWDNGSDPETQEGLVSLLRSGKITSLHLDSRNTKTLYNKAIFNSMACSTYYVVSDNDILPPNLKPDCWLSRMVRIMEENQELAMLCPQFPPISHFGATQEGIKKDHVECKWIGNVLKLVRKSAFPEFPQRLDSFGDDSFISELCTNRGWTVGFCRRIFAKNLGQCENWGYKEEELSQDPRKAGYKAPLIFDSDNETCVPDNLTLTLGYP
jgi:hypothetical protein